MLDCFHPFLSSKSRTYHPRLELKSELLSIYVFSKMRGLASLISKFTICCRQLIQTSFLANSLHLYKTHSSLIIVIVAKPAWLLNLWLATSPWQIKSGGKVLLDVMKSQSILLFFLCCSWVMKYSVADFASSLTNWPFLAKFSREKLSVITKIQLFFITIISWRKKDYRK